MNHGERTWACGACAGANDAEHRVCVHCGEPRGGEKILRDIKTLPPTTPSPKTPPPGLDALYEFEAEAIEGGMGILRRGRRLSNGQEVMLKRPRALERDLARFLRETKILATMRLANVVTILDSGEDAEGPYLVMPFYRRGSLQERVANEGPLDEPALHHLATAVAKVLRRIHENGILHRDLKPSNILLDDDDQPLVADFGLAWNGDSEASRVGRVVGTPGYAAPEQRNGQGADARSDIYGLGHTLRFAATGHHPPDAPIDRLPVAWREVLAKCTEPEAVARYQTCAALLGALAGITESRGPASPPAPGFVACAACTGTNPETAPHCSHCGKPQFAACLACKAKYRIGSTYCGGCGVRVEHWPKVEGIVAEGRAALRRANFDAAGECVRRARALIPSRNRPADALESEASRLRAKVEAHRQEARRLDLARGPNAGVRLWRDILRLCPDDDEAGENVRDLSARVASDNFNRDEEAARAALDEDRLDDVARAVEVLRGRARAEWQVRLVSELTGALAVRREAVEGEWVAEIEELCAAGREEAAAGKLEWCAGQGLRQVQVLRLANLVGALRRRRRRRRGLAAAAISFAVLAGLSVGFILVRDAGICTRLRDAAKQANWKDVRDVHKNLWGTYAEADLLAKIADLHPFDLTTLETHVLWDLASRLEEVEATELQVLRTQFANAAKQRVSSLVFGATPSELKVRSDRLLKLEGKGKGEGLFGFKCGIDGKLLAAAAAPGTFDWGSERGTGQYPLTLETPAGASAQAHVDVRVVLTPPRIEGGAMPAWVWTGESVRSLIRCTGDGVGLPMLTGDGELCPLDEAAGLYELAIEARAPGEMVAQIGLQDAVDNSAEVFRAVTQVHAVPVAEEIDVPTVFTATSSALVQGRLAQAALARLDPVVLGGGPTSPSFTLEERSDLRVPIAADGTFSFAHELQHPAEQLHLRAGKTRRRVEIRRDYTPPEVEVTVKREVGDRIPREATTSSALGGGPVGLLEIVVHDDSPVKVSWYEGVSAVDLGITVEISDAPWREPPVDAQDRRKVAPVPVHVPLSHGRNVFTVTVIDSVGNRVHRSAEVDVDLRAPALLTTTQPRCRFGGKVELEFDEDLASVVLDGQPLRPEGGRIELTMPSSTKPWQGTLRVRDHAGNEAPHAVTVVLHPVVARRPTWLPEVHAATITSDRLFLAGTVDGVAIVRAFRLEGDELVSDGELKVPGLGRAHRISASGHRAAVLDVYGRIATLAWSSQPRVSRPPRRVFDDQTLEPVTAVMIETAGEAHTLKVTTGSGKTGRTYQLDANLATLVALADSSPEQPLALSGTKLKRSVGKEDLDCGGEGFEWFGAAGESRRPQTVLGAVTATYITPGERRLVVGTRDGHLICCHLDGQGGVTGQVIDTGRRSAIQGVFVREEKDGRVRVRACGADGTAWSIEIP